MDSYYLFNFNINVDIFILQKIVLFFIFNKNNRKCNHDNWVNKHE